MSDGGYYDGGGQGSSAMGQFIRWALGLLIALVGVGMYMFRTQVNPVTGEKQRVGMSVADEKALGLQAAPQMADRWAATSTPATTSGP